MPFSSELLRPLPDISLATWDLATLSQHHCIRGMLPMKIYPYLSYRREINETDVNDTCNLQNVLLFINLYSIYNSNDQLRFFNPMNVITVRKGREKGQFSGISYLWIEVFLKEVLGLLLHEGTTIIPNLSS